MIVRPPLSKKWGDGLPVSPPSYAHGQHRYDIFDTTKLQFLIGTNKLIPIDLRKNRIQSDFC